jgi:acyl-coenzyme A synthetase/AMP-(fatty) acid ligase
MATSPRTRSIDEVGRAAAALKSLGVKPGDRVMAQVDKSAVIGVPHADFGEGIIAVVTSLPGKKPPSESDIIKLLGKRLAKLQLAPSRFCYVFQHVTADARSGAARMRHANTAR